jgi:hypothetical protein
MMLLNFPPETLAVHVTVPVGADVVPGLVSVTVTVSVIEVPCFTEAELGDILALVVRVVTVNDDVPELCA